LEPRLHRKLTHNRGVARKVALLEKIGNEPEAQRFSLYSEGGGPGAVFAQVQKIFCHNMTADPGTVPIITTYFLYQAGYCETSSEIVAHRPTFERQVNEMVAGIERRPAVMLLELDAVGSSSCMARSGALPEWEADIRYEIQKVATLPHAVVYIEGGYSDSNSPGYTARVLNAVGVQGIRGFYTNDTHMNWTANEIRWGDRVSALTGGTHFIVNTADNGHGPLLNPHPVTQGIEDLCNPPGRGAGIPTTTATGNPAIDAFMWVHVPGTSSGRCNGGTPSGTFWLARALTEARNANARLGPRFVSRPF
jgi:endoglucanase